MVVSTATCHFSLHCVNSNGAGFRERSKRQDSRAATQHFGLVANFGIWPSLPSPFLHRSHEIRTSTPTPSSTDYSEDHNTRNRSENPTDYSGAATDQETNQRPYKAAQNSSFHRTLVTFGHTSCNDSFGKAASQHQGVVSDDRFWPLALIKNTAKTHDLALRRMTPVSPE